MEYDFSSFWSAWWEGELPNDVVVLGLKIFWWERIGLVCNTVATVLLLVDVDRLEAYGRSQEERVAKRKDKLNRNRRMVRLARLELAVVSAYVAPVYTSSIETGTGVPAASPLVFDGWRRTHDGVSRRKHRRDAIQKLGRLGTFSMPALDAFRFELSREVTEHVLACRECGDHATDPRADPTACDALAHHVITRVRDHLDRQLTEEDLVALREARRLYPVHQLSVMRERRAGILISSAGTLAAVLGMSLCFGELLRGLIIAGCFAMVVAVALVLSYPRAISSTGLWLSRLPSLLGSLLIGTGGGVVHFRRWLQKHPLLRISLLLAIIGLLSSLVASP